MRPISWLHVSDIHMSARDAWSQDVVLKAMCERVAQLRKDGVAPDLILTTGDLAYSGKAEEYALVRDFFDALCNASGVPTERVFCVPGNHDIDRSRQKLCFKGARSSLVNQQLVDEVLAPDDDLATLLEREQSYRQFQNDFFSDQERTSTPDGLAYISRLVIDDIHLVIVGLDSAWASEGGASDHGNLLIGERQVINAVSLTETGAIQPHVVISMAHHPCHLLREFDRSPVQGRIERDSQFFHCGHLHLPEARAVGQSGTGCLVLAAGASFETRQSQNTFSIITIDILNAKRQVTTLHYEPQVGSFSTESRENFPFEVAPKNTCNVGELMAELCAYRAELRSLAAYLAALLLDQKAELPIPAPNGYVFGSFAVLSRQDDSPLKERTSRFLAFRNVLRALYDRLPVQQILARHGASICTYGAMLIELSNQDPSLATRLQVQEQEARSLANTEPSGSFAHTVSLLDELARNHEWEELHAHAVRYVDIADADLSIHARRMLALALAHSEVPADKVQTIELYRALCAGPDAVPTDFGNLANLLLETGDTDSAKSIVIRAIDVFPEQHAEYFSQIGHRIVESTGDRAFREQMEQRFGKRGKRG